MSAIRNRIENWFEGLAHLIYRHRVLAIIIMLGLSGALASQTLGTDEAQGLR